MTGPGDRTKKRLVLIEVPLEHDPGDVGAADTVGGKLGIGAGIDPLEIIGRPLRGGDRAEEAADVVADGLERPDQAEIENRAGEALGGQRPGLYRAERPV